MEILSIEQIELLDRTALSSELVKIENEILAKKFESESFGNSIKQKVQDLIGSVAPYCDKYVIRLFSNFNGFYIIFSNNCEIVLSLTDGEVKVKLNYCKDFSNNTYVIAQVLGDICKVLNTENNPIINCIIDMQSNYDTLLKCIGEYQTISDLIKLVAYKKRYDVNDDEVKQMFDNLVLNNGVLYLPTPVNIKNIKACDTIRFTKSDAGKLKLDLRLRSDELWSTSTTIADNKLFDILKIHLQRLLVTDNLIKYVKSKKDSFMYNSNIPFLKLYKKGRIQIKYIGEVKAPMVSLINGNSVSNPIKYSVFINELYDKRQYIE